MKLIRVEHTKIILIALVIGHCGAQIEWLKQDDIAAKSIQIISQLIF